MSDVELGVVFLNAMTLYMASRVAAGYARWLWRDSRKLLNISAGLLVFVVFYELLRVAYESGYYGAARVVAAHSDINMWTDPGWAHSIVFSKASFVILVAVALTAKARADGRTWSDAIRRTRAVALESALVALCLFSWYIIVWA